ncbi:MAG: hypothetical protein O3B09_02450, partial [Proteobacteria bacterium]|nr:hypothetical protein [Pseudomonadota bacterium]
STQLFDAYEKCGEFTIEKTKKLISQELSLPATEKAPNSDTRTRSSSRLLVDNPANIHSACL